MRQAESAKPAIVADGHPVSHAELAYLIRQYSAGLAAIGLQPEVRMLMFGTDSLDYVVTWLASIRLGAIPVVVSDLYKQRELLYFLVDTGARVLFIDSEQLPKLIEIAAELPRHADRPSWCGARCRTTARSDFRASPSSI